MIARQSVCSDPSSTRRGRRYGVHRTVPIVWSWLLLAALAALAAPAVWSQAVPETESPRPLLQLGIGDMLNVQIYGRPELETTTYVTDDGSVTMPLAGPVTVVGLSPASAAQRIADTYQAEQLLRDPQVTILLLESRSQQVSVLGEVRAPGQFSAVSTTSLLDLLAAAGGMTEASAGTVIVIRRDAAGNVERHPVSLRGLEDGSESLLFLAPRGGDTVFVPEAEQFYIYGAVHAPNMYRLEPNMTVLQAIALSGGLTDLATTRRIDVKRETAGGEIITERIKLTDRIRADDVIYVKERFF